MMTFAEAREQVLAYLASRGWKVTLRDSVGRPLKTPYATSPDGWFRLWFKPQAIHFTEQLHNVQYARSLWVDIRQGGPAILAAINKHFHRSY